MTDTPDQPTASPARPRRSRMLVLAGLSLFFVAVFVALGIWQVERLQWKRDLIARVDARVHAPASALPDPSNWASVTAADDEYRHVSVTGRFAQGKEALVYASTAIGPGYWVLAPLIREDGAAVFVNRGFVPLDEKDAQSRRPVPQDPVTVTGLLRLNEPNGTLLRSNNPDDDRWYSRDVVAMAGHLDVTNVAPFFIDADASPHVKADGSPIGGLTVVQFPNSHLSYAITWFGMALLSLVGGFILLRAEKGRGVSA